MAVAALNHENTKKFLPTGGWGHNFLGDPDMGFGHTQPGSWPFSIMTFMDGAANIQQAAGFQYGGSPSKQQMLIQMATGPNAAQPMFYCPTRRPVGLYPITGGQMGNDGIGTSNIQGANYLTMQAAKTDYGGNFGDVGFTEGPESTNDWTTGRRRAIGQQDDHSHRLRRRRHPAGIPAPWCYKTMMTVAGFKVKGSYNIVITTPGSANGNTSLYGSVNFTGVVGVQSEVALREVPDGVSKVYLFGEKSMSTVSYGTGVGGDLYSGSGDEESIYNGFDDDFIRLGSMGGWAAQPASMGGAVALTPAVSLPPQQDSNAWPYQMTPVPPGVVRDYWVTYRFGRRMPRPATWPSSMARSTRSATTLIRPSTPNSPIVRTASPPTSRSI